ncbi:aryl-alcohol dehydrogenase-like predicted oxidoreductase [Saccharothrix carnea]|uniref:Aryl-alcohol dehydrogenase-like predicted oxidoreductase n=1 Tax=Saccharothrix carnea TaxID=1280637 RepID=A0A2P8IFL0_SACCR|nr:aldo/keto reductase [Saccharothrix carnea]PSL57258.1 aryl-alcohol dehydrogenase-like predicted oxidoreductase [Saccharothrix carnea]
MVEKLALGAMLFGTVTDERRSFEILDRFVDAGGVWIDTANCYSFWEDASGFGGQSEALLGRWLASRPGVRDRVRISTKVGCEPTEAGRFPETAEGLSAGVVKKGIEGSLRRLGTDHVELYWAHKPDPVTPLEETVAAFDELVSAGAVGRLGCSNYPVWQVERARQIARDRGGVGFTAVQQHHTYLRPRPGTQPTVVHRFGAVSDEVIHYLEHHPDMALWAYTPLLSGRYTRADKPLAAEYDHAGTTDRLAVLDEIADETGANRNQVVLAWLTGGSPAATPIVGVSTVGQLDDALAGAALDLTDEQRRRLDAAA